MTQASAGTPPTPAGDDQAQRQKIVDHALEQVTPQHLTTCISHDPSLGARMLKGVNSAFYGLPGQIGSINRAIVLLGLNAVKNIAIAASLAKLFRGGEICPQFNAKQLWTHSIAVAAATRLLAQRTSLDLPDEAFLAGLIHDLGIMVEIQAIRPKFVEAMEKRAAEGLTFREAEQAVIGATHEDFGAALCKAWKFPVNFIYVTGYHHRPLEISAKHRSLASLVYIADRVAARAALGYTQTVESMEIDPAILAGVNLTAEQINTVAESLPQAMDEATMIFAEAA